MEIPDKIRKYSPILDWATGLAVLLLFATAVPSTIPKLAIVLLASFGSCSIAYHSIEKRWITFETKKSKAVSTLVLLGIVGVFTSLAMRIWPVEPYWYFLPAFGPSVNTAHGVRDAFLLVADNPTNVGIEGVQVDMIEKPEQNESLERGKERTQNARSCNVGYLRAKEHSAKCSFMIPLDTTGEKSFWLNIETKDSRFHEDLIVWWDGKQWQGDFDLLRIQPEGEKTIRKMKSH